MRVKFLPEARVRARRSQGSGTGVLIRLSRFHQACHFARVGVAAGFKFGVDRLSVHNNVKNASSSFLQLSLYSVLFLDFRCDTRSSRQVVSFTAVLDQDLHRVHLSFILWTSYGPGRPAIVEAITRFLQMNTFSPKPSFSRSTELPAQIRPGRTKPAVSGLRHMPHQYFYIGSAGS